MHNSEKCITFATQFENLKSVHIEHEPYYYDRLTERDLCHDFPADEIYIDGLHAMQSHFITHNVPVEIPVVRVMNVAHYLLAYVFATTCSGDQAEYDVLTYGSVGHDKKVMFVTLIVLAAMLKRTDGMRARSCRSLLLEDRSEDFYDGVSLYEQFLQSGEAHFAQEDFLIDTHTQIQRLTAENERLTSENIQLKYTLTNMKKDKPQTIVYNYGTYNDIHDNPYSNIYTTAPTDEPKNEQTVQADEPEPVISDVLEIPHEGKYSEVRKYLEERKRFDAEFKDYCTRHSLRDLCTRLTKEFGWFVDEHSLGANLNRNR